VPGNPGRTRARLDVDTDPGLGGTSTGIHPGSRNAVVTATSSTTLGTVAHVDAGPGGNTRLTSASTAMAANGPTRTSRPGPRNG
jgi:hypothetical protein